MIFFAALLVVLGCWLILLSGRLSGKTIAADTFLEDAGLWAVIKHIFSHNPFAGYRQDPRIAIYGITGLVLVLAGIGLAVLFFLAVANSSSR